jgi:hypothetical protein
VTLSNTQLGLVLEYLEEIDSIIEADDGTLMPIPFIDKHEEIKEIFE